MNKLVIVHGKPTEERYNNPDIPKPHEANWLPWLGVQFEQVGAEVHIPAMPRPFFPVYQAWKQVFDSIGTDSVTKLVGHSAGTEFLLRWLSEQSEAEAEQLVLVAPYRDEVGKYGDFSKYELDKDLTERVGRISIFSSLDDSDAIQRNAYRLAIVLGADLIELDGFGHFMSGDNMPGPEFTELHEVLLS